MLNRFGRGSRRDPFDEEDINPMAGTANLADAMLVLAVGIMLALIINWKIDVSTVSQITQENMTEVTDYDNVSDDDLSEALGTDGLEEKGTVYMDPETGKMYVVVTEGE